METQTKQPVPVESVDLRGPRLLKSGLSAAALATVVNLWVLHAALEVFSIPPAFELLDFWHIFNTTVGVTVVATLIYAVVGQYTTTNRPNRLFTQISGAALVLSYVPFLLAVPGRPGATFEAVVVLASMHVTTAIVVVSVLVLWTRSTGGN